MSPVTEIAYIPLKPGVDLDSGESKKIWTATLSTIRKQEGVRVLRWGLQVEEKGVVQMAIDWDSLQHHNTFIASPAYAPFLERLNVLLNGTPTLFHVKLQGDNSAALDDPVTECLSLYFSPTADTSLFDRTFTAFADGLLSVEGGGVQSVVGGWGVEPHEFNIEGKGGEKKFFGAFVGWPSVETHMEFRERDEFPGIVRGLREEMGGIKMHHVRFLRFEG